MKTLKYRSAFVGIFAATLSVFLFTACEKESDSDIGAPTSVDRLEKFRRLTFNSGSTSTSSTSTSSGTFTGSGGNISRPPAIDGAGNFTFNDAPAEPVYSDPLEKGQVFTDPKSAGPAFGVDLGGVGFGTGNVKIDNGQEADFDLDFAICATTDVFGFGTESGDPSGDDLKVFIGIDIDGTLDDLVNADPDDTSGSSINHIVYIFQYGGSTTLGTPTDFDSGMGDGYAFVFIVRFDDDGNALDDDDFIWMTSASTFDFDGGTIRGEGTPVFDSNGDPDPQSILPISIDFECGSLSFDEED